MGIFSKQGRFIQKMKIASKETFFLSPSAEVVKTSFEVAHMISQVKKPHNIGKTLIKPCMIKAASLVLGVASSNKLAKISLSYSTIKTRIDELANDIKFQVLRKIQESSFFAILCDGTTDVAQLSQLLTYIRYVGSTSNEEEMLFCRPIDTTTTAKDLSNLLPHTSMAKVSNGRNILVSAQMVPRQCLVLKVVLSQR